MAKQFKLRWPVDNPRITQYFGENPQIYNKFNMAGHEGMDFGVVVGTNIYACADGAVSDVETDAGHPYGTFVRVNHFFEGSTYQTIYAHLSRVLVSPGQAVKAGDVICLSGNTGHSFGPHLHLTLKLIGAATPGYPAGVVDPNPYFQATESLEPSDLSIYAVERVRLRSGPTTASVHIAWIEEKETLIVLGDADDARAKVGQVGQWIPVRRAGGTDGYVAAWYTQLDAGTPAPPVPKPEPTTGVTTIYASEALNIRKQDSVDSDRVAIALPSDPLAIIGDANAARKTIGDRGSWLRVRIPDGSKGYAAAWYVQTEPGPDLGPLLMVGPTVDMNMRQNPSTSAPIIARAMKSAQLEVHDDPDRAASLVGRYGKWLYVETIEGQRGWVAAWYVKVQPPSFAAVAFEPMPTEPVLVYASEALNVHKGLSFGSSRVAVVLPHEPLPTLDDPRAALSRLGQKGEWLMVRTPSGRKGHVPAWLVQTEAGPEAALLLTVYPLADMEMYERPTVRAKRVGPVSHDAPLTVLDDMDRAKPLVGRHEEWFYVETEAGQRGWIPALYTQVEAVAKVKTSERRIGGKYTVE